MPISAASRKPIEQRWPVTFRPAFVRFFNGRAQLVARDVHIRFEGSRARVRPIVHHASRVVGTGELMHHGRERPAPFEIRRGDVHLWPDHAAGIDQPFDFQIGVRRDAAGGANRGDAKREIETRETAAHVRVHRRRATHRKEHVVVHAHQTGQDV